MEASVYIQLNIDLIAKQPTLNRAASAATHFQGKYTSIQIRESTAAEAVMRYSTKRSVLKNFLNIHRKTPVSEPLSNKFAGLQACNLIEKRLQHRCFPVDIEDFLRTPIMRNICEQFLLQSGSLT